MVIGLLNEVIHDFASDYNRPTSLYNWRTFSIVWFFFQSVDS